MRAALIGALAIAGCSAAPDGPDNRTQIAPASTSSPIPTPPAGAALTGTTSALNADISGLNVRTSDTQVIVDLPADTLFAFDKADLTPQAAINLGKVADLIRQAPAGPIQVTGHTDAKGDDSYNLGLSEQRAQSVVNWMREQVGVRQRQFEVVGKGESDPVALNTKPDGSDDPEGRAQNRRVVVAIPR